MKSDNLKHIAPDALERHFRMLIGQAILWLGVERVLAIVEMERREKAE